MTDQNDWINIDDIMDKTTDNPDTAEIISDEGAKEALAKEPKMTQHKVKIPQHYHDLMKTALNPEKTDSELLYQDEYATDEIIICDDKIYRKISIPKSETKEYILTFLNQGFIWSQVDEIIGNHDIVEETDNLSYYIDIIPRVGVRHIPGKAPDPCVDITLIIYKYEYDVDTVSHQMEYKSDGTSDLYWEKLSDSVIKLIKETDRYLYNMTNIPTRLEEMEVDKVDATGMRPFPRVVCETTSINHVQGYDNFQCNPHPHLWRANLAPDEDEIFVDTIRPWTLDDSMRKWVASGVYTPRIEHNRTLRPPTDTPTDICQEGIPDIDHPKDKDDSETRLKNADEGLTEYFSRINYDIFRHPKDIIDEIIIDDSDIRLKNAGEWLTEYSSQINYDIGKKLHDILHK